MNLLNQLQPWHWALLGVVLVILEIFMPGVYLLWLGIAAGIIALFYWLFPEMSWQLQVLGFGVLSILSVAVGYWWLNRHPLASDQPALNRRAEQYVGRVFTLDEPIVNGRGKLRVDDTLWSIEGPECEAGSRVKVTGADGVVLVVECVE